LAPIFTTTLGIGASVSAVRNWPLTDVWPPPARTLSVRGSVSVLRPVSKVVVPTNVTGTTPAGVAVDGDNVRNTVWLAEIAGEDKLTDTSAGTSARLRETTLVKSPSVVRVMASGS